uniref:Uncharacterized protein n=1 Tax=Anopheles darlingi TaxID=43151 RepID=A0A2M4DAN9_ANODA
MVGIPSIAVFRMTEGILLLWFIAVMVVMLLGTVVCTTMPPVVTELFSSATGNGTENSLGLGGATVAVVIVVVLNGDSFGNGASICFC